MAQDPDGDLIAYRSESLDQERGEAVLAFLGKDTDLFTEADSQLDVQLLSNLAEPKLIPTNIPEARLRLTLAWGEISTLVTGYRLLNRKYAITCTNAQCPSYRSSSLEGKTCRDCKRPLHSAEIAKVTELVEFEQSYHTQYQAPCLKVEINPALLLALQAVVSEIKEKIISTHGNDIPEQFKDLWTCTPEFIVLHTVKHQIIKAVPLVVLSSSLDIDAVVDNSAGKTVGYFFDTSEGGSGGTEAIFYQLPKFATKALALARSCDCESGCPRCLTQYGCPQQNSGLHKEAGLFLLEAISKGNEDDDF